ncbi:MAG TPA: ribonuclease III [Actinomycetota bacterium]|nr:ribonuclease III [Actinomycetota bacterium]
MGVPPQGGALYDLALTHRSLAFEQGLGAHNERLEFLGDAILDAVVTGHIYDAYPDHSEGDLARLRASVVNTGALAELARELDLGRHIRLGKGEDASGGRDKSSLLADCFEALVGAIYLDQGYEAVRSGVLPLLAARISDVIALGGPEDAKTALQERAVKVTGALPTYQVASAGPDHNKSFTATVSIEGRVTGRGAGRSKKEAEQNAARVALDALERQDVGSDVQVEEGAGARAS